MYIKYVRTRQRYQLIALILLLMAKYCREIKFSLLLRDRLMARTTGSDPVNVGSIPAPGIIS